MAQRSKPKPKSTTSKSASNKGAPNLLEDTLERLSSIAKDAETTLSKVRRAVKDAAHNVTDGAGDLASHLPVVGQPKKQKPKARKPASSSKKNASKKSVASAKPSAEKKSSTSASKKADSKKKSSASASKTVAEKKPAE